MGTRATYRIMAHNNYPEITCYLHWDGYPQGACYYFGKMLKKNSYGLVNSFIHANNAEITPSHKAHGDTEYRYDIYPAEKQKDIRVHASKRYWGHDNEPDTWRNFFSGSLIDFLQRYAEEPVKLTKPCYLQNLYIDWKSRIEERIVNNYKKFMADLESRPQAIGNVSTAYYDYWSDLDLLDQMNDPDITICKAKSGIDIVRSNNMLMYDYDREKEMPIYTEMEEPNYD